MVEASFIYPYFISNISTRPRVRVFTIHVNLYLRCDRFTLWKKICKHKDSANVLVYLYPDGTRRGRKKKKEHTTWRSIQDLPAEIFYTIHTQAGRGDISHGIASIFFFTTWVVLTFVVAVAVYVCYCCYTCRPPACNNGFDTVESKKGAFSPFVIWHLVSIWKISIKPELCYFTRAFYSATLYNSTTVRWW